jgi:hypothetical protein
MRPCFLVFSSWYCTVHPESRSPCIGGSPPRTSDDPICIVSVWVHNCRASTTAVHHNTSTTRHATCESVHTDDGTVNYCANSPTTHVIDDNRRGERTDAETSRITVAPAGSRLRSTSGERISRSGDGRGQGGVCASGCAPRPSGAVARPRADVGLHARVGRDRRLCRAEPKLDRGALEEFVVGEPRA